MRQQERGMTLVEILVAVAIFVIAAGGILLGNFTMHQASEYANHTLTAVHHLDDIVEDIYATEFGALQAKFPAGVADGGAGQPYVAIVGSYALDNEQIVITYPAQTPTRLEMLVTVTWVSRQRPRSMQLSTVRTQG